MKSSWVLTKDSVNQLLLRYEGEDGHSVGKGGAMYVDANIKATYLRQFSTVYFSNSTIHQGMADERETGCPNRRTHYSLDRFSIPNLF